MGERRPHRGEKIESFAHRRHDPGGIASGIGSMPDRSHDPPMELAQALLGHARESMTVLLVSALADRKRPPFDVEPLLRCGGLHHLDAFRNDFGSDVVAEQDADLQARAPAHCDPFTLGCRRRKSRKRAGDCTSRSGVARAVGWAKSLARRNSVRSVNCDFAHAVGREDRARVGKGAPTLERLKWRCTRLCPPYGSIRA